MRKPLLIVLGVLIVLALATPFGMGMMAKKRLYQLVEQVDNKSSGVQISIKEYNLGWFTSDAMIDVKVKPRARRGRPGRAVSFSTKEVIHHGPVVFVKKPTGSKSIRFGQALIDSNIVLPQKQQAVIDKMFAGGDKPKLEGYTLITLIGAIRTTINMPAFTFSKAGQPGSFEWKGMTGRWNANRSLTEIHGGFDFAGMTLNTPKINLNMSTITIKFEEHGNADDVWTGKGSFVLPSIHATNPQGKKFAVEGIAIDTDSNVKNNLMNTNLKIKLASLAIDSIVYGPAEYSSSLNNLDALQLDKIRKQIADMNKSQISPQQRQIMMMSMLPQWPKLLDHGAEFVIDTLKVKLPEGMVDATGSVKLLTAKPGQTTSPMAFIQRIVANSDVQAPTVIVKRWVEQMFVAKYRKQQMMQIRMQRYQQSQTGNQQAAQQMQTGFATMTPQQIRELAATNSVKQIQLWIERGYLQKVGDSFKIKFEFKGGKLTINGKPFQRSQPQSKKGKPAKKEAALRLDF